MWMRAIARKSFQIPCINQISATLGNETGVEIETCWRLKEEEIVVGDLLEGAELDVGIRKRRKLKA